MAIHFKRKNKKEKEESLFFDYDEVVVKKVRYVKRKTEIENEKKIFFNHSLSDEYFQKNIFNVKGNDFSRQVVVKNLSNLDRVGAKNALAYVLRNSNENFILDENFEERKLDELYDEWSKDFSNKKNSKEVWHLAFSIKEKASEENIKILKDSVYDVMSKNFFEYKFAFLIHTHQNNPHAHIIINKNNKYTKKKLHLKKDEFKALFNNLRNDFALALNARGLFYHNKYRLERNLDRELYNTKEIYKYGTNKNMNFELAKMFELTQKNINEKERKTQKLANELKEFYKIKNDWLLELARLRLIDEKHKKSYKVLKEIKKINQEIKNTQRKIKTLRLEIKKAKDFSDKLENERYLYKHIDEQSISLKQKASILSFFKRNIPKEKLTLHQKNIIDSLERELKINNKELDERIRENIKASLIVSSVLGKKNTSYQLLKSYKELEYNLNILRESYLEKESYEKIEKRLENNLKTIKQLIIYRYESLEKDFENNIISLYKVKEYEKNSLFLNRYDEEKIKRLYERLNINTSDEKDTIQTGGNEKEKEKTQKQEQKQEKTKEKLQDNGFKIYRGR